MANPEGTPAQGASERQLRQAWDKAHKDRYKPERDVSPEEVDAAEERLNNVMARCQGLWGTAVDKQGTTFTEKRMAIESAYRNVKEMIGGAAVLFVPFAALAPQLSDSKHMTAIDSAIAGSGMGVLFLAALGLAKMVEQIRLTALSVSTKERK